MKNKKYRLQLIVELVKNNCVGSQNELSKLLQERGLSVTQATLSRDLKMLRVTKVANEQGGYMYMIPAGSDLQDTMLRSGQRSLTSMQQVGFVSLAFSGNIVIIKTRNGYATGIAYDIDMGRAPEILGTIAGADTVFAVMREDITRRQAVEVLSRFLPLQDYLDSVPAEQ